LQEFMQANSALQMPFFNVIYAGQDGHIFYLFGGRQPVRNGGSWGTYSGILDGSNPSLLWTDTFAFSSLPQAIDPPGGFVANSNNPPWTSAFSAFPSPTPANDPANFPAYVSPQFMDLRPQNGAFLLQSLLQSKTRLSVLDVLTAKESTYMLLADRVLPDLINAASGNSAAQAAVTVLSAWDRTSDSVSVGAVLFEAWWALVTGQAPANQCPPSLLPLPPIALDNTINFYSPHPQFRVAWDPNNPVTTPYGLANAAATVPYLICAATLVQNAYAASGGLRVPWGAVHDVVLAIRDQNFQPIMPFTIAPQSGADSHFGPLRVVGFPEPDGLHYFPITGDGYVQLVEFTPQGKCPGSAGLWKCITAQFTPYNGPATIFRGQNPAAGFSHASGCDESPPVYTRACLLKWSPCIIQVGKANEPERRHYLPQPALRDLAQYSWPHPQLGR